MSSESTPLIASEDQSLLANTKGLSHARFLALLFALYFGVYLAALDTTVVSTLLGHIASDLKQLDNISWVATGYLVAYSAFQPLYGKLSDIFGRKVVMVFSAIAFGAGCQLCGMAYSLPLLVVGRFVSGVGAGGMLSMSTITVSDYVPLRKRGIFQGIGNICFGIGAASGGIFGGWATSRGGWRLAFTLQVPLTVVCIIVMIWIVEDKKPQDEAVSVQGNVDHVVKRNSAERLDFVGSLSLVSSLILFMFAVTTGGHQYPWASLPILASFVGSAVLGVLFFIWEKNYAVEPVLPIPLLLHRTVIFACLTNFFGSGLTYSTLYYGPVVLSALFGYSYDVLANRIVANFVGVAAGSLGAGIYMRKTGRYYTLSLISCASMILSSAIFLALPYTPYWLSASAAWQQFAYVLSGLGYASMLTVSLVALIAAVPPESQATSTSAQYTFRGAGSSVGIALAASLFQNTLASSLVAKVKGKHAAKIIKLVSKSVEAIREVPKKYQEAVIESYANAGVAVFAMCVVFAVLATICTGLTHEHPLDRSAAEQEPIEDPDL